MYTSKQSLPHAIVVCFNHCFMSIVWNGACGTEEKFLNVSDATIVQCPHVYFQLPKYESPL
jgi:hypothetical protein